MCLKHCRSSEEKNTFEDVPSIAKAKKMYEARVAMTKYKKC